MDATLKVHAARAFIIIGEIDGDTHVVRWRAIQSNISSPLEQNENGESYVFETRTVSLQCGR